MPDIALQNKIQDVLNDLINKNRFVFWYDKDGEMSLFITSLDVPGVRILIFENNAFSIKHQIIKGEQPERGFIIYFPSAKPKDEDNWLLDIQMMASVFYADMGSLYAVECGIPLELKCKVVDKHLEFFKLLDNRKRLAKNITQSTSVYDIEKQMLSIICKTEPNYDQLTIALAYDSIRGSSEMMQKMESYNYLDLYWSEVEAMFGYNGPRTINDLMIILFTDDLNHNFELPKLRNEAFIFMRDWRDSRQHGDLYKEWASYLEKELEIEKKIEAFEINELVKIETYPCVDKVVAMHLQNEVLNDTMSVENIESIVDDREHKPFFSVAAHTIMALLEARRLFEDIDKKVVQGKFLINSPEEGFQLYFSNLYSIDFHYRHYFREENRAESKSLLADVTKLVEKKYTNSFLLTLASRWQPIVDAMKQWNMHGVVRQRDFFNIYIAPFLQKGNKVFVIISDALRYETMVELDKCISRLNRMSTTMKPPMLGMLPSYTQLGMAALLPNSVLSYPKQDDEVFVDSMSSKGTDCRNKILKHAVPNSLAITAKDFLNITNSKTYFRDYDLIYIYSNKIDFVGDKRDTEREVFKATDEEIDNIIKIVELIRNGNGSNIFITSDHGYLYQNEQLDDSDFTDFNVMGDVISDTRRFIIGNNLLPGNPVKTWNSEALGIEAGRQIQIAKGMVRLRKQGSGSRFVHGGAMLQEIVVPLLHVNIKKAADVSFVDVDVLNFRAQITTNHQTICFYQNQPVTEKQKGLTLKIGFYDEQDKLISDSVTLVFDSDSTDSRQREKKHQFMFKNVLSSLNGHEVKMKMERKIHGSEQYTIYRELSYIVKVMFQTEF